MLMMETTSDFARNHLVIDDSNYERFLGPTTIVGDRKFKKGLIPRDFTAAPQGYYKSAPPYDPKVMPLIPRDEWPERIAEKEATKSRISDIRLKAGPNGGHIPSLDQDGQGYCWFYSGTGVVTALRFLANMPYVRLSAHSGAWVIKNGRDQGGWGCQGLDFIQERGVMPTSLWPEKYMGSQYNTPENWEIAKQFRVTESWMDLNPRQYDRNLSLDQSMSCLLRNIPCILDYNWWGHSVHGYDAIDLDKRMSLENNNRWGIGILNSWTDSWGTLGYGILRGNKCIPDGGAAPRVASGSDYVFDSGPRVDIAV